jgi:hypothetical protein
VNQDWIDRKFSGLSRDQLREAGKELGCNFGKDISEHDMRIKLCEKLGETAPAQLPKTAAPVVKMQRMQRPRLAPGDKWEGRCHDVIVHHSAGNEKHKSFVLYWNFVARSFAYDTLEHMPEPYFNIMKAARVGKIEQEPILDKFNFRTGTNNIEVWTPLFSFEDRGITPGTEKLPGSILEYWQWEAQKNNYFRALITSNVGRNRLIQIRSDLMGSVGHGFYKDLTNEDIWTDIIRFLGYEHIFYEDEVPATA